MHLNTPIDSLPRTSPITIRKLKNLGINTYWDLLNYFPFRYEPFQIISAIANVQNGETVTIIGKIEYAKFGITKTGLRIVNAKISDNSGSIEASWFNQPYLLNLLKKDLTIAIAGEIKQFGRKFQIIPKEYEFIFFDDANPRYNNKLKHTGRLIPVYPEKRGLSSKTIREKIYYLIDILSNDRGKDGIPKILPKNIMTYNYLIDEEAAYKNIHFPESLEKEKQARERLAFDEMFLIQLSSNLIKQKWKKEVIGHQFFLNKNSKLLQDFIDCLPFTLTDSQKKVIDEILMDLQKKQPMNRLLQGEVGSGKTVVATVACYLSYLNGYQSLFMGPTEILAQQHYQTITGLFNLKFKIENFKKPNVILITGSNKPTKDKLSKADIIIGTHALIQKKLTFQKIGLVIVDEQHRFGVNQRAELKNKGINPHLLTMTATPIPRTVMLTLYGELDISIIDELPKNRIPIKTYVVPKEKRLSAYNWIQKQIETQAVQAYIVCPLIEESEIETMQSVRAATQEFEYLQNSIFKKLKLGLLHGKLKAKEKQITMEKFVNKQLDILVTTSVVEVGVDIPNATIMVIEGAERYGLAQLHQLRGRIGRGTKQSYCLVFTSENTKNINDRLHFFAKNSDGNLLAEKDMKIRGPGNIFGSQQHGYVDLKIASLNDYTLIEKTKKAVEYFMRNCPINKYPELEKRLEEYNVKQIAKD